MHYCLPPPMAGFFEFSLMRVRADIDQKALSELFYQYINVEEDFIQALFVDGETQLGRVFVHEAGPARARTRCTSWITSGRARSIQTPRTSGVGMCYCRHKMEHVGRACDAPLDICMTFNGTAGLADPPRLRPAVDAAEGLDLLQQA